MSDEGKNRYNAVQGVEQRLRSQGKWRKKGDRITQEKACREIGITTRQYRKWKAIISLMESCSLETIYSALEDKRYAPNKITPAQEMLIREYARAYPEKSFREIAIDLEGEVGKRLHHSTVSRVMKNDS